MKRSMFFALSFVVLVCGASLFRAAQAGKFTGTTQNNRAVVVPGQSQACPTTSGVAQAPTRRATRLQDTKKSPLKLSSPDQTCAITALSLPQTVNGALSTSDCFNSTTGHYSDLYSFAGTAGQQIAILLTSTQFDTRLGLLDPNLSLLADDDDGGGGSNSRIPAESGYFTLTTSGRYTVVVTSYDAGALGSYTLNLMTSTSPTVTLLNHRTTSGPFSNDCTPPPAKTAFAPTDETVYQWVLVSGARNTDIARWDFYQPNGSLYLQTQPLPMNYNGEVCFWGGIYIAGQAAANLPGTWQVRCFYNDVLLVTDTFTIGGNPTPTPTPTATPTPTITPTPTPTPGQCITPPAGLVAWWPGDGNANDIQGQNNGTVQGGVSFTTGQVGQGFTFNSDADRVSASHNANLNVQAPGFTADFWMKGSKNQPQSLAVVFEKSHGFIDSTGWFFQCESTTGKISFGIGAGGSGISNFPFIASATDVLDGNFHLVAGTWDGSTLRLYVDGVLQGSQALTTPANNTRPVNIGFAAGGSSPQRFFRGVVDEAEVFNRALSGAEIQALVNAGGAGKCKTTPGQCSTPPAGLISWWPGDGNANDIQGANNGALKNGATYTTGLVSQAFQFDGVDDYLEVADANSLDISSQLTVDAWVKPSAFGGGYFIDTILSKEIPATEAYVFNLNNGRPEFSVRNTAGSLKTVLADNPLSLNAWQHVTATYDGTQIKLYVNGQLVKTEVFSGQLVTNDAAVTIGHSPRTNQSRFFAGAIDEVEIFNRALSAAEIQTIVSAGSAGKCKTTPGNCVTAPSGALAWLPGDGNASDLTGTHNGTLKNGALATATGKVGQAFSFDGENDYVDMGAWSPGTRWSLEAWVNPASLPTNRRAILGGMNSCDDWALVMQDGKWGLAIKPSSGACTETVTSNITAVAGTWYHLVGTSDGTTARIYVNGELKGSGTVAAGATGTTSGAWIGGNVCCTEFFPGLVDEAAIYNRALSLTEIQAIYNAGSAGKCKGGTPGFAWTPTSGPTGVQVWNLFNFNANIFAGTNNGVFRTNNDGATWTAINTGLPDRLIYGGFVALGTNLFVGTEKSVSRSTDLGNTWTSVSNGLPLNTTGNAVTALAVNGTSLFAGLYWDRVYRSNDNGASWTAVNSGLPYTNPTALLVSGGSIYLGTGTASLFRSDNNGASWTAARTGIPDVVIMALAASGTNLFAGTDNEGRPEVTGGVYLSTNQGQSWTAVNTGLANQRIRALWVSGNNLFAGTLGGGVFVSNNNGQSWTAINEGLTNLRVSSLVGNETKLFAGTYESGVFVTTLTTQPACPTISGINPLSGTVGSTVTITGTNLTGVTVRFTGGVTVTPNVNSAGTELTVTVPNGAQTGTITLTKAGCGDVQSSASFTVVPVGNCVTPPTQMVAWWPFDTNTNDLAGSNHGTPSGGPVFTAGKVGQGLQFDGVDDYVSVSVVPTPDLLTATGMTFDLWIKPAFTQDREYPIVDFSNLGGLKGIIFGINYSAARGGTFYVAINDTNGVEHLLTSPDFSVANGVFQHLTATYDRATGVAKLYVNGVEKVSQTLGGFTARYASAIYIGRFAAAGLNASVRFAGVMDELEVLARAMSAAEIQALVNADSAGKCKAQTPCPTVTGMTPASGPAGTNVTITGTNFTGVTAVRFANNVSAQFTINSATQITTTVPSGAVTGPITLSKPNCTDVQTQPFTVTTPQCIDVAISTSLTAGTGTTLTVPITVTDTTGKGVIAYDTTITFDPAVLRLQSVPTDKTGTLSSNFTITANSPSAGQLRISGFGSSALTGAGTLLNLKFDVIGAALACSNLNFTSFRFNEGTPCAATANGRACVTGGGIISGAVSYCIAPKPVPGVTLNITGSSTASATTNSNGAYTLPNLNSGNYTLTPAKTGDVNGIASFDAALVAQHVVGITTLNQCQQLAGDTSNNGELSSFDAALIAQFVVGISNPTSIAGTWKFVPPTRSYTNLSSNQTNQNFDAVLVGDVSGNWAPASLLPETVAYTPANAPTQAVQVSLPELTAAPGASLTIPITVGDLTGRSVIAYDLDLTYDAGILQAQPDPTETANTLSSAFTVTANPTTGRLRVSGFGTTPLTGSGVLLQLRFAVLGNAGANTALTWQKFQFNEGTPPASLVNGRVVVMTLPTLSFSPAMQTLAAGNTGSLTLIASVAPTSTLTLNLTSADPNIAAVPPTATIPAGQTMTTFNVTAVAVGGPITISAALPSAPGQPLARATVTVLRPVACVSAASFTAERMASEAIVAAFGLDMATATVTATSVPLPTSLAGTTVSVRDSAGNARLAPLFFVSPGQINYQIPSGTVNGSATITVTSGTGIVSTGRMMIATVAPGLFTANANGQGVPAAWALRVKADGSQLYEPIASFDAAQQRYLPLPFSLGPEGEQVYLILYGTGIRNYSNLANVQLRIGNVETPVAFIGAVEGLVGLDQLNAGPLPRSLAGRGEINLSLQVDGQTANAVTIAIR